MKGYEIVSRPAGGIQLAAATCSDGFVHMFGYLAGVLSRKPACGADLKFGRPTKDDDHVCLGCSAAAESWAQGGALNIVTDRSPS